MNVHQHAAPAWQRCGGQEPEYARRYAALFDRAGQKFLMHDGVLWASHQRMVVPIGAVNGNYLIAGEQSRHDLLRYFKDCILIRTGSGFVNAPDVWYAVLCDSPPELSRYPSKHRSQVKQGLKNCAVRKLDADFIAKQGWPVYRAAFRRYKNTRLRETERQFKQNVLYAQGFEDIVHYWGVFEKSTGRLIAYAQNYAYGKVEVYYWNILFHPDYLRLNSSHALFYEMNRHYLLDEKFAYINEGLRNLLHRTRIQDYLVKYFFSKYQPIGLQIHYRPVIGACVKMTYPYRNVLEQLNPALGALYKLEEINRAQCVASSSVCAKESGYACALEGIKANDAMGCHIPVVACLISSEKKADAIIFKRGRLTASELSQVATLHRIGIASGFLSFLGMPFLRMLYRAISQSKEGVLIAAFQHGQLVGFVGGASQIRPIYDRLWKHNAMALPFVLLPRIFDAKVMRKLIDLFVYIVRNGGKQADNVDAELLSMVVAEKCQGKGIAQMLFEQLRIEFKLRGITKFKIIVGDSLKQAKRFYEKMGAQKSRKMQFHPGEISWEYIVEVLRF